MRRKITGVAGLLAALAAIGPAAADPGKPVAVRWWGQAFVTIETYWNLTVAIDPYATRIGYDDPGVTADVVLVTHHHADHNNISLLGIDTKSVLGLDETGDVVAIDMVLDRPPDQDEPTVTAYSPSAQYTDHAVRFRTIASFHDDQAGNRRGNNIVAHENVRRRMNAPQFQEALARNTPASPSVALPIVTFNDTVTFHWNGDEIRVFHVDPAHTDGDSIIHFVNANVFHMGDTFFKNAYPFVDLDSGGDFDGVIAAATKVLAMVADDSKIIPGHGELATKADLQTYIEVLTTIRGRVVALIEQGKSEDEVVEANPTREWDATWGQGFMNPETWTRIIYKSLSRN